MVSDLRSRGLGFDSRSVRCQVVTTWMGDCLRTGKQVYNQHQGQLGLPSPGVGKSSTGLYGWGYNGARSPASSGM